MIRINMRDRKSPGFVFLLIRTTENSKMIKEIRGGGRASKTGKIK